MAARRLSGIANRIIRDPAQLQTLRKSWNLQFTPGMRPE